MLYNWGEVIHLLTAPVLINKKLLVIPLFACNLFQISDFLLLFVFKSKYLAIFVLKSSRFG